MLPIIRKTSDSWMPDIFNDFFDNSWMERPTYTAPAINVLENDKEYEVELAAPGLTKDDFRVHVDEDNNLHIEMEKKSENKEGKKHGRYLRREFSYEKFQQTLLLPEDAEADKIEAKVEHGVLNVHIPKKERPSSPKPSSRLPSSNGLETSPIDKGRRPHRATSFFAVQISCRHKEASNVTT